MRTNLIENLAESKTPICRTLHLSEDIKSRIKLKKPDNSPAIFSWGINIKIKKVS